MDSPGASVVRGEYRFKEERFAPRTDQSTTQRETCSCEKRLTTRRPASGRHTAHTPAGLVVPSNVCEPAGGVPGARRVRSIQDPSASPNEKPSSGALRNARAWITNSTGCEVGFSTRVVDFSTPFSRR